MCSICLCVQMYTQVEIRGQHQVSYSNHLPFEKGSLPGPSPHWLGRITQWIWEPAHLYQNPVAQTVQPCLCFLSECWGSKLRSSWLYNMGLADAHLPCPSVVFLFVSVTITFFHSPVSSLSSDGSAALLGKQVHICRCCHPGGEHLTWSPTQKVWVCQKQ